MPSVSMKSAGTAYQQIPTPQLSADLACTSCHGSLVGSGVASSLGASVRCEEVASTCSFGNSPREMVSKTWLSWSLPDAIVQRYVCALCLVDARPSIWAVARLRPLGIRPLSCSFDVTFTSGGGRLTIGHLALPNGVGFVSESVAAACD